MEKRGGENFGIVGVVEVEGGGGVGVEYRVSHNSGLSVNSDASFRSRYKSGAGGNCLNCLMDNPGLILCISSRLGNLYLFA